MRHSAVDSHLPLVPIRGRGAAYDPPNRFERLVYEPDPEVAEEEARAGGRRTQYFRDTSRTVIAYNQSPDVGFDASVNPYRGCEHGCIYCYARPTHEYLGFSAGLDFESRILVKLDAPRLLRRELAARRWRPQVLAMSGVTDPYQPGERRFRVTRGCLEVLVEFRNPVVLITKSHLVTRDADLLGELARHRAAAVGISITTLDPDLRRVMEPRASIPERRLEALASLTEAGVPVRVMVAPVIPGLTDHEIPRIVRAARAAGAVAASYIMLRLPHGVRPLFEHWLEQHFPDRKERVLNRVRGVRGGQLNDPRFGRRMRGEGVFADQIRALFRTACRQAGFPESQPVLSTAAFRRPDDDSQLTLL